MKGSHLRFRQSIQRIGGRVALMTRIPVFSYKISKNVLYYCVLALVVTFCTNFLVWLDLKEDVQQISK